MDIIVLIYTNNRCYVKLLKKTHTNKKIKNIVNKILMTNDININCICINTLIVSRYFYIFEVMHKYFTLLLQF